jgi:hypothetical protein
MDVFRSDDIRVTHVVGRREEGRGVRQRYGLSCGFHDRIEDGGV